MATIYDMHHYVFHVCFQVNNLPISGSRWSVSAGPRPPGRVPWLESHYIIKFRDVFHYKLVNDVWVLAYKKKCDNRIIFMQITKADYVWFPYLPSLTSVEVQSSEVHHKAASKWRLGILELCYRRLLCSILVLILCWSIQSHYGKSEDFSSMNQPLLRKHTVII